MSDDAQLSFRKSANVDRVTDKRKDSLFRLVDTDGSGTIDAQEFAVLYDAIKKDLAEELEKEAALQKEASSARRRVKMLLLFVAVLVSFLAASVAANFAVIFTVVDTAITTTASSSGFLEVKGSDTIAKTAIATQDVPLMAAPAMDMDTLSGVRSLKVTYSSGTNGGRVEAQLAVVGVRKHNSTFVEFVTDVPGETVETLNGIASLVRYPTTANGLAKPRKLSICSANASCSAFTASGIDANAALALAEAELEKVGFDASRRLQLLLKRKVDYCPPTGQWQDFEMSETDGCAGGCKFLYFDGHAGSRDVVFVLHGRGMTLNGMWMKWSDSLKLEAFEGLMFAFVTSGFDSYGGNGQGYMGWNTQMSDSMTYQAGFDVLEEVMCGAAGFGSSCTGGFMASYGVGPGSAVMMTGFSNGGAMSLWASWRYGDIVTAFSSVDYQPNTNANWLSTTYAASSASGFAGTLYYSCESPTYNTYGVSTPTDPTELTYWGGIGATELPDSAPTYVSYSYSDPDIFTGSYPFRTSKWTSTDGTGRFFKFAVQGLDADGDCTEHTLPDDWPSSPYPSGSAWNFHMAMNYVAIPGVVSDILAWVSPPPASLPAYDWVAPYKPPAPVIDAVSEVSSPMQKTAAKFVPAKSK